MGVGRPNKYSTVEELNEKIEHYFNSITFTYPLYDYIPDGEDEKGKDKFKKVPKLNNAGEQVQRTDYLERPSVLAMCRHLEITRETLSQYQKMDKFSDTIKRAKSRIEEYLENQLYRKDQVTGIIFNLKNNFGWKDKHEQEITGEGGGALQVNFNIPRPKGD